MSEVQHWSQVDEYFKTFRPDPWKSMSFGEWKNTRIDTSHYFTYKCEKYADQYLWGAPYVYHELLYHYNCRNLDLYFGNCQRSYNTAFPLTKYGLDQIYINYGKELECKYFDSEKERKYITMSTFDVIFVPKEVGHKFYAKDPDDDGSLFLVQLKE